MEIFNTSTKLYSQNKPSLLDKLKPITVSIITMSLLSFVANAWAQSVDEWIDCAAENELCLFDGSKNVRYGSADANVYAYGVFEDEVLCANSIFGDPARKTVKRCSYSASTNLPPVLDAIESQYNVVGDTAYFAIDASDPEGGVLSYNFTGLPTGLSADTAGIISGTLDVIGDFTVDVTVIDDTGTQTQGTFVWVVTEASDWILCAGENELCDFSGVADVRYGAEPDSYYYGEFIDGVNCSNSIFGDPARKTVKYCYYQQESTDLTIADIADRQSFVGQQANVQVVVSNASSNVGFHASGLPDGLTISNTGLISGVFSSEGISTTIITVSDGESSVQRSFQWVVLAVATQTEAMNSSGLIYQDLEEIDDRLWVVNPDNNSVSVFNVITDEKITEIVVDEKPESLVIFNDEAWVVNRDNATITVIDAQNYSILSTIFLPVASQPYGIVTDALSQTAYVSLAGTGQILKIDLITQEIIDSLDVGQDVRGLSIDASASFLYASRFITPAIPGENTAYPDTSDTGAEVVVVSLSQFSVSNHIILAHSDKQDSLVSGRGIPNYLRSMVISPDGNTGWVPSKQDNIKRGTARDGFNISHENSVRAISSKIDLDTQSEVLSGRLDHDNASIASAAAYHPSGNYLFVSLETSREIAVVDLVENIEKARIPVGRAPKSLTLSPSGDTLFVHNFMDRTVTRHNVESLLSNITTSAPALATYSAVNIELLDDTVFKGKQFFYDASDERLALEGYLSCASCHEDAGHDGRVWDLTGFGEGMRNTIPLTGRAGLGNGRLHWTGNFDEVQDFETQIRDLAAGTGLMSNVHYFEGTRNEALGDSKAGFSDDLDAIAVYLSSLTAFPDSPWRNSDGTLSASAENGKALFAQSGCVSCHSGTTFTDSATAQRHDVGTIGALSGSRLGELLDGFDTPTLRGLWQSAPYLHDGSAPTLEDAIKAHDTATLSDESVTDIAAYLLSIDSREVSAPTADVWQLCAAENETCTFTGIRQVRYGANDSFNYGTYDSSVQCRNSIFGDPARKTEKFCYYRNSEDPIPTFVNPGTQLSELGDSITLQVVITNDAELSLSYSATNLPDGLTIDAATAIISGNAMTVGNYSLNVIATYAGIVQDTVEFTWVISDGAVSNDDWIYCANENAFCGFSGDAEVRYGGNNTYYTGTFTDGIACNNSVFGDPTPKMAKTCEYRLITSTVSSFTVENPGDQVSLIDETVSLQITAIYSDDMDLNYAASNLPDGLSINSSSGLISGTAITENNYDNVEITVTDGDGHVETITFSWRIDNSDDDTATDTDGWAFCANENETCSFIGTKQVRYGSEQNYFYGIYQDTVLCSNNTFGDPTPKVAKTCSYNLSSDLPPVVNNPGSTLTAVGSAVAFTISASDPEDEVITYSASGMPDGIVIDESTGSVSGSATTVGVYSVVVTVSDSSLNSTDVSFTWTVQTEVASDENWVLCASDGDICNFDGEQKVRFGADGTYNTDFFTDSVLCTKSAFGDPLPGVEKSCYYEIDTTAAEWTYCSEQDEICHFSGTKLVRYGAQRAFNYRVADSSVSCSDTEFGDPIQSVVKRCEVRNIDSDDAYDIYPDDIDSDDGSDAQWVYCSPNGFECHFSGDKQVRYILGDEYVEISATDYVLCTEDSFPTDPVVDAKKKEHCEVRLSRSDFGEWSDVQSWPVIPVSTTLLPDGRIMANNATNDDLYTGYADVTLWDPIANTFSLIDATQSTFAEKSSEMFCAGFDLMPDGNLLIAGSEPNVGTVDNLNAERFDFREDRFSRVNDNAYYRYYPSMTTMPSGDMVTFAGTNHAAPLEIFKFDGTWDELSDTQDTYLNDYTYYAWGQTAPNGQLFYPGPDMDMKYFDLRGEGEEIDLGPRDDMDRDYGSYALYDIGKILITGGAKPATNTTTLIDINGPSPIVTAGPSMSMPRRHGNLTILSDGTLLKTGGHTGSTHQSFEPEKAVYSAEIWSPETNQWTTVASMRVNRLYHSTAILLPDGRVFSGGTGYPFELKHNQSNGEIYSPPYLFNSDGSLAERPSISSAPDSVGYDHNFTVDIDSNLPIEKVHLIKLGTVTHHQNFGQRLVPLTFEQHGNQLALSSPEGANIAPPGYYMLIAVDSDGRPSVAKMLQVLPHSTVNLYSASTHFMLDIAWGDTYENAFASLSAQSSDLSQMWSIQPIGDGYFKFISRASGYALSNMNGTLALGSDTDSFEEQWQFVETNSGYYALQSRADNLYLKVDMNNPGQLQLTSDLSDDMSMQWQVLPVGDINLVAEITGQVLDAGDAQFDNDGVSVASNTGTINQAWYFEAANDGYTTIRSRSGFKALAILDSDIVQEAFNGTENQQWRLVVNMDGSFKIESRVSQLPVASNGTGYSLSQVGVNDSSEAWRIVPAVSGQPTHISEGGGQILYRTLVQGSGLELWKTNGQTSGNDDLAAPIEAVEVSVNGVRDDLIVEYQVYDEFTGWSAWAADTETAGEIGEVIYGLRARLDGQSDGCVLQYRVYAAGNGWMPWRNANEISGSEGTGSIIHGVQFTLVCQDSYVSHTSIASAKLEVTAGSENIDDSSFRENAFEIMNTSSTQKIVKVEINISETSIPDIVFDPIGAYGGAEASCFKEGVGGSETGFWVPADPCTDPYSQAADNGYSVLTLEFSDFDPGESFFFGGDIDPTSIYGSTNDVSADAISGLELSGAIATFYFDDGSVMSNQLFPDGSLSGAQSCASSDIASAPIVTVNGDELPSSHDSSLMSLDIFSEPNVAVKVFVLEGPVNSIVDVAEYLVVTDEIGYGVVDIELTQTTNNGGYNHILAAVDKGIDGCTGHVNKVGVVQLVP